MRNSIHPFSSIENIDLSIHHSSGTLGEVFLNPNLSGVSVSETSQYEKIKNYDSLQLSLLTLLPQDCYLNEYGVLPTKVLSPALISKACLVLMKEGGLNYSKDKFTIFEKSYTLKSGVNENIQPLSAINTNSSNLVIFTETLIGGTTWSKLRLMIKGFDHVDVSSSGGSQEVTTASIKDKTIRDFLYTYDKVEGELNLDPLSQSLCGYILSILINNVENQTSPIKNFPTIILGSGTMAINANLDLVSMLNKLLTSEFITEVHKVYVLNKVHSITTEHVTELLPPNLSIMIRPSRMFTKIEVEKYKYLKGYNLGFVKEGAGMGAITDLAHHLGFTLENVYNKAIEIFNTGNKGKELH